MKQRPEDLLAAAQKTAMSLPTGSWPAFLRTAAWNFKYDFTSQLLIFAQKPDATACAPHDLWASGPFQRQPRKGTAIALLANNGPESDVRYVFDISDTFVKKGAHAPVNPVWDVTKEKEPAVRKALAEAFLPYEQQTGLHLASGAGDFYRSVAASITADHFEASLHALTKAKPSCALNGMSEMETERTFRSLLAESISAMLQFRCGLIPEINERILAQVKRFNSIDAISILGNAVQNLARQGLLEVSHAVHAWDTRPKEKVQLAPSESLEREEDPFGISEEDINRAITIGPPLEEGKYRLQLAAEDPNRTSEQLAATLREEYGTGKRAFLLANGIDGFLSWGPEGLKIGRIGLQEGVDLILPWKTASERLKRLVAANLYLSDSEKCNFSTWTESQKALSERQKTGAALSAILNTLPTARQDLPRYQEQVRAYVYENSTAARQTLTEFLRTLQNTEHIQNDAKAQSLLHSLTEALASSREGDSKQILHGRIPDPFSAAGEKGRTAMVGDHSTPANPSQGTLQTHSDGPSRHQKVETCRNATSLYTNYFRDNDCIDCTPTPLKDIPFAHHSVEKAGPALPSEAGSPSVATGSDPYCEPPGMAACLRDNTTRNHQQEPFIDHPELRRKELYRLDRSDKVALTDLLYHYITYRYTFQSHTPPLSAHDAACRAADLAVMDEILVSPSIEENLKHLRLANSILTRWFLPFEGIRPEILAEQENLIKAAEQVLSDPPKQAQKPMHDYAPKCTHVYNDNYNYTHIEPLVAVGIDEVPNETLWDYETTGEGQENPIDTEHGISPLIERIRSAQARTAPPPESTPEYTALRN